MGFLSVIRYAAASREGSLNNEYTLVSVFLRYKSVPNESQCKGE